MQTPFTGLEVKYFNIDKKCMNISACYNRKIIDWKKLFNNAKPQNKIYINPRFLIKNHIFRLFYFFVVFFRLSGYRSVFTEQNNIVTIWKNWYSMPMRGRDSKYFLRSLWMLPWGLFTSNNYKRSTDMCILIETQVFRNMTIRVWIRVHIYTHNECP